MTNAVFGAYHARGIAARQDMIITQAERDADPLVCDGEQFLVTGSLPNWVDLD